MNKVAARFKDGRVAKGTTADFVPARPQFHLAQTGGAAGAKPDTIQVKDLKALFFVKDFAGNREHVEGNAFDAARPAAGRRIRVVFADGEVLVGTTTGYQPGREGFFLVPADPTSNIERCYVVVAATREITFL